MNALSHPYLLAGGSIALILGLLLRRWASRHDLKDLAIDAAWQVAKARGDLGTKTELGSRFENLAAETSNTGRAKLAAGYAARHAAAQIAGLAGLLGLVVGAALIGAAFYLN